MKPAATINTRFFALAAAFYCCFYMSQNLSAQTSQNTEPARIKQETVANSEQLRRSGSRISFVKIADFHLRDGTFVSGKLIQEDKTKITVEQLDQSKIVVSTYSRKDIDTRTLRKRSIPESRHYLNLAEYFSGRTWDFQDDPDDFIQAIRCYEKAGQLLAQYQNQKSAEINQINEKIKQLQADREVWTREVQSRAKLRKLEFETEIEKKFGKLKDEVKVSTNKLDKATEELNSIVAKMKENYEKLEKSISEMDETTSRQLKTLEDQVRFNRRLIDRIDYYLRWYNLPSP